MSRIPRATWSRLAPEARWVWIFPLLAAALLWDCLFAGEALLPTRYLLAMEPWRSTVTQSPGDLPPWNALQFDGAAEFYPWRFLTVESIRGGTIPLWNPHQALGIPLLANSQSAPIYPFHWLLAVPGPGDLAARLDWLAFLHLMLAGLFTYALARQLGCRPATAALAGVTYQLAGFSTMWLSLPSFLEVSCWLPLVLLALERVAHTRAPAWLGLAGLAIGMMVLAGHLQVALFSLLGAALWCLWLLGARAWSHRSWREGLKTTVVLLAAGLLGLMLAAPQLLPTLELSAHSHRVGAATEAGYRSYVAFAMPPWHWITLLAPDYYGMPLRGDFWGGWRYLAPNVMEYAGGIGIMAWILALLGVAKGREVHRGAVALAMVGALGLLIATGSPLVRLLYFYLPGFAQSGSPARALLLTCLAGAALAGLGAEWLLRRWEWDRESTSPRDIWRWARQALTPWALTALIVAMGLVFADARAQNQLVAAVQAGVSSALVADTRSRGLLLAWQSLLGGLTLTFVAVGIRQWRPQFRVWRALPAVWVLLVVAPQWALARENLLTSPQRLIYPATPLTNTLQQVQGRVAFVNPRWSLVSAPSALMPPNIASVYGLYDVAGYDSLLPGRAKRFLDRLAETSAGASPLENGNMALVKSTQSPLWPLTAAGTVVRIVGASPFSAGRIQVEDAVFALPMAYLVADWRVADDGQAFTELERIGLEDPRALGRTAFLSDSVDVPRSTPGELAGAVDLTRESPTRFRLRYHDVPATQLLVVSQTWDAGWKAYLEYPEAGPRRLHRVNTNFQGIFIPEGSGILRLRYEPDSFRIGAFLGLLALTIMAALIAGGIYASAAPATEEVPVWLTEYATE